MLCLTNQASSKKHSTSIKDAELHRDTKEMAENNEHYCATEDIELVG